MRNSKSERREEKVTKVRAGKRTYWYDGSESIEIVNTNGSSPVYAYISIAMRLIFDKKK